MAMHILGRCNGWNNFIPLSRSKDLSLNSSPVLFIWQNRITFAPLPLKPSWLAQAEAAARRNAREAGSPQKSEASACCLVPKAGRHLEGSLAVA